MLRLGYVLAVCVLLGCMRQAAHAETPATDFAVANVLFETFQGNHGKAYERALYLKQRAELEGADTELAENSEFSLMMIGAALQLGQYQQGLEWLSQLEVDALLPESRSRLRFFLAEDAYRRRDWHLLGEYLVAIPENAAVNAEPQMRFLRAENQRMLGHYRIAERELRPLLSDSYEMAGRFGTYNLAAALSANFPRDAIDQLRLLLTLPVHNAEMHELAERARLALGGVLIKRERYDEALFVLSQIRVNGPEGVAALAQMADMAARTGQTEQATRVWTYLVENHPWQRGARRGHLILPYLMETTQGQASALEQYVQSEAQLAARMERIESLKASIQAMPMDQLSDWTSNPTELGLWLSEQLGHEDWTIWLANGDTRRFAERWQRISDDIVRLRQQRQRIEILLAVNEEQRAREQSLAARLENDDTERQISVYQDKLYERMNQLDELLLEQEPEALASLGSEEEQDLLQTIHRLEERALRLNQPKLLTRIKRLEGRVLYEIYADAPVRVQAEKTRVQTLLAENTQAAERVERIVAARASRKLEDGVDTRLAALANTTHTLLARSEVALEHTSGQLLAALNHGLEVELAELAREQVQVQLAQARISDQQLLAGGDE